MFPLSTRTTQNTKFPDPFSLAASEYVPTTMREMFDLCALVYSKAELYKAATARVVSHFITRIQFDPSTGDKKEHANFEMFLVEQLHLLMEMLVLGEELQVYGNCFRYIYIPFTRSLVDNRSGSRREISLKECRFYGPVEFDLSTLTYDVVDPQTWHLPQKSRCKLNFCDRYSQDLGAIRIRPLDPRHVILNYSGYSDYTEVLWTIDPDITANVKAGRLFEIDRCPIELLKAIRDSQCYKFAQDEVFFLKNRIISGLTSGGFGLPDLFFNLGAIKQLLVYRGIEEAVGRDFILPFRCFVPAMPNTAVPGGSGVPLFNQEEFRRSAQSMIAQRRLDPTAMFTFTTPVNMLEFGKDGKYLIPAENLERIRQQIHDGAGYPAELFRGSLAVQQIPATTRAFERTKVCLSQGISDFARWVTRKVRAHQELHDFKASMASPSTWDDESRKQIRLQLMQAGLLTKTRGLQDVGVEDGNEEAIEVLREDSELQIEKQKIELETQRSLAMLTMDDAAAAENGGGGGGGGTPLDRNDEARSMAQQYLGLDVGERQKALSMLESQDYQMYALVKQKMEERRSEGESMGRQMVSQPQ